MMEELKQEPTPVLITDKEKERHPNNQVMNQAGIKIKLKDASGKRGLAYVNALEAIIRYQRKDKLTKEEGKAFFFVRTGQFEYAELPSGVGEKLEVYMRERGMGPGDLTLAVVDKILAEAEDVRTDV